MKIFYIVVLLSFFIFFSGDSFAQTAKQNKKPAPKKPVTEEAVYVPSTLLQQVTFFDGLIKVTYPAAFKQIPRNILETRYPDAANRPKIVMAPGDNYNVNFALNLTANEKGDRGSILRFFRDIKQSLRDQYPNEVEFMSNDVENSTSTGYLEVILPNSQRQKIYNLMYFGYIDANFFFMNFSCPVDDMDKWQKTAWAIKESVKLRK
jgi:hypothetical protein